MIAGYLLLSLMRPNFQSALGCSNINGNTFRFMPLSLLPRCCWAVWGIVWNVGGTSNYNLFALALPAFNTQVFTATVCLICYKKSCKNPNKLMKKESLWRWFLHSRIQFCGAETLHWSPPILMCDSSCQQARLDSTTLITLISLIVIHILHCQPAWCRTVR